MKWTCALFLMLSLSVNVYANQKGTNMSSNATSKNPIVTVIFDNNPYKEGLQTAWGFACLIQLANNNILFDTGGDGTILLENMEKLAVDFSKIDIVVISHIHGDHAGGLEDFLNKNAHVTVFLPASFPLAFKNMVRRKGAKLIEVATEGLICKDVMTTGELGTWIKEQSLIVDSEFGAIIITGCAHPGIVHIIEKAKQMGKKDIFFVMGGFHLGGESESTINNIIAQFKKLGVKKVGPCHCTGDKARELFKKAYGENYIDVGVGKVIKFSNKF